MTMEKNDKGVGVQIRMPTDLHVQLKQAANEHDLSMNFLCVQALRDFLPRLLPADEWRLTR
jgi:predicted HicB family RNase H-like nuclease